MINLQTMGIHPLNLEKLKMLQKALIKILKNLILNMEFFILEKMVTIHLMPQDKKQKRTMQMIRWWSIQIKLNLMR